MIEPMIEEVLARLRRVEDELAIQRIVLTYGPAADAGLTSFAAGVWFDEGVYDWDADEEPLDGRASIDRMLQGDGHQGLIADGAAHFAGPPIVDVDGDRATALNYSLVMLRSDDGFRLWRVSAVRWELERSGTSWRVTRRTNRLLDASGGGRRLFGETLQSLFGDAPA